MRKLVGGLMLAVALVGAMPARGAPTDEVRALLEQGKSREAYDLGAQHPELLGNPQFDYFFGVAAVDAGHSGEGVLALERYVIRFPADPAARMQLGRAYFILGDDARARQEFENALRANPPEDVRLVIERFLDAIRLREGLYRNTAAFYLEAGGGYDSNVNAGVSAPGISLPVLGPVTVLPAGVRQHDSFGHLAAGGQVSRPVAPGIALFATADGNAKLNSSKSDFNLASGNLSGGATYAQGRDLYRLSLSHNTLAVNDQRFRDLTLLNGEWSHPLDQLQFLQLVAQIGEERYAGDNAVRNADYAGAAAAYRRVFAAAWQPAVILGASYGKERNTRDRPDLGRDIYGVRAGAELVPRPRWGLSAGLSWLDSRYDGPDLVLGTARRDKYIAGDVTATYLVNRSWSARAEALLAENHSNLELFSYRRYVLAAKLRYEFK